MADKISFIALSTSGTPIRRITVSRSFLRSLVLLFMLVCAGAGWLVYDYTQVKFAQGDSQALLQELNSRKEEISTQRHQIQNFAEQINQLKDELVALHDFENKIRIIANIEQKATQDGLFGIGGSIPEDLDTSVPLQQRHDSLIREMHEQTEQLEMARMNQESGFSSLLNYLEDQRNLLACTPAIRPVDGWVTSRFGYRESLFTGLREFHKGMDIANRAGTPILATADGVVAYTGRKGLLGMVLTIDHGHGFVTRYGHIQKALKKRGETVKRGEPIALVGNTGRSTGPHVHYEVMLNGVPVNPLKYILN
ncbi:hypothetical protein D3OALGB2SA_3210 [Olavius algarvensis associated proteobacterium Delta 3]|nr:hypothetical protein D3OALGB2SA_3210 [Olavius algarvensis associated proteobacterium Delta 3]